MEIKFKRSNEMVKTITVITVQEKGKQKIVAVNYLC